jgi:hypothetical protein
VVILGTLERANMRRFNLRSVATQYGMRQARIQARRGRRSCYNPPPMNTYRGNESVSNKMLLIIGGVIIILKIIVDLN